MRRINTAALLGAMALLAGAPSGLDVVKDLALRAEAQHMVAQFGHRVSASVPPAEMDRRSRQRRRARQTHPGKRGGR